jgi:folate-binding protein YgfZ
MPVDVVRVAGPDAAAYLQGQLSQDVAALGAGDRAYSFVLAPTGKIDAFVEVVRAGDDDFELRVDAGFGDALDARLRRFLLRTKATVTLESSSAAIADEADEAERVRSGRLSMAHEIDERTVPAETGWVDRAVSFTKGCYTGQELVARMDSRVAEPPRRLVRLAVTGAQPGDPIVVGDAEVGAVTSAAGDVALGYVKRGTPLDGPARVADAAASILGVVGA